MAQPKPLESIISIDTYNSLRMADDLFTAEAGRPEPWFTTVRVWPEKGGVPVARDAEPCVLLIGLERIPDVPLETWAGTVSVIMQVVVHLQDDGAVFSIRFTAYINGEKAASGAVYLDPSREDDMVQCWCKSQRYIFMFIADWNVVRGIELPLQAKVRQEMKELRRKAHRFNRGRVLDFARAKAMAVEDDQDEDM